MTKKKKRSSQRGSCLKRILQAAALILLCVVAFSIYVHIAFNPTWLVKLQQSAICSRSVAKAHDADRSTSVNLGVGESIVWHPDETYYLYSAPGSLGIYSTHIIACTPEGDHLAYVAEIVSGKANWVMMDGQQQLVIEEYLGLYEGSDLYYYDADTFELLDVRMSSD